MNLTVEHLERATGIAESMASFGKPLDDVNKQYLLNRGLDYVSVVGCLKWLWFQCLSKGSATKIRKTVTQFVEDEMERQKISPQFHHRARHDVLLIQCAAFASSTAQLKALAGQVVDASGFGKFKPRNDGELYTSAWCGIFKYWILGEFKRANEQAEIAWGAYRPPWLKAGAKPLTIPWIKRDWDKFLVAQKKDFGRLWSSGRKNGALRKETTAETTVTVDRFPVEQVWCWAHCGMALLAYRTGVDVLTDPFWFPPHALKIVPFGQMNL